MTNIPGWKDNTPYVSGPDGIKEAIRSPPPQPVVIINPDLSLVIQKLDRIIELLEKLSIEPLKPW